MSKRALKIIKNESIKIQFPRLKLKLGWLKKMHNTLNTNKLALILLVLAATISACRTATKTATKTPNSATTRPLSIKDVLQRLDDNVPQATRLSADGSLDYAGKPMNISASMTLRWRRDSAIWLHVRKLGFGVARAFVNRDSVFALNLIQSTYVAKNLNYIEQKFGLPADFALLQDFLLGKPVFLTDKKQLTLGTPADGDIVLRGQNDEWKVIYRLDTATLTLKEMIFEQPKTQRMVKIFYENYAILHDGTTDRTFAFTRRIVVESPQTGKVNLTLDIDAETVEVNVPKSMRFEIPNGFEKMD